MLPKQGYRRTLSSARIIKINRGFPPALLRLSKHFRILKAKKGTLWEEEGRKKRKLLEERYQ